MFKNYSFNVITIPFESYNDILRIRIARDKQAELLDSYEYVLYADADEIVIPNPKKYKSLKDYIKNFKKDVVSCQGYNLIQMNNEEPIDLDRPILKQRNYWQPCDKVCKPLLARVSLDWCPGFHNAPNTTRRVDKNLWLLHLHRMDFDICWAKHQKISHSKWSEVMRKGYAAQYRIKDLEKFKVFFRQPQLKKGRFWFFPAYVFLKIIAILFQSPRISFSHTHGAEYFRMNVIKKIPKSLIKKNIL